MTSNFIKNIGNFLYKNQWFTSRLFKSNNNSLRIVYYHMISDIKHPFYFNKKSISKSQFELHIKFFIKYFKIVNFFDAINQKNNPYLDKPPLVITFDDGFRDNIQNVLPILKKYNIQAVFFISTNFIDNKDLMWRNKLLLINRTNSTKIKSAIDSIVERFNIVKPNFSQDLFSWSIDSWPMKIKDEITNFLWHETMDYSVIDFLNKHKPYVSSNDLLLLEKKGHLIGSHSCSHPSFSKLNYDEFKFEIISSIEKLESILNKNIFLFSYPFGRPSKKEFELRFMKEEINQIKFFGIKNIFLNDYNALKFERDNAEFNIEEMLFRFYMLPYIRKYGL